MGRRRSILNGVNPYMPDKIILCPCNNSGCPTIEKLNELEIEIVDDYGGKVRMKINEAELIADALKSFDE